MVPRERVDERCRELLELVGLGPRALDALPAPVLRRPASAREHCAGARARARAARRRRARLGTRRLGAGDRAESAGRSARAARPDGPADRPQHGGRPPRVRPRRGHVPRPDRGGGADRRSSSPIRGTRTRRGCSGPFRGSCRAGSPTRRRSSATCRARSIRRAAVTSIRAVRSPCAPRCAEDDPELASAPSRPEHVAACHFAWSAPPPAHIPEVELNQQEVP